MNSETPSTQNNTAIYHMIEALVDDSRERISKLQGTVEDIAREVSSLSKILRDGNGQPPLTVRMALIEQSNSSSKDLIEELRGEWDESRETAGSRTFQTVLTCISSLISIIMAVVMALVVEGLKHP